MAIVSLREHFKKWLSYYFYTGLNQGTCTHYLIFCVEIDINVWEISKSPIEKNMAYSNNIGKLKYLDNGKSHAFSNCGSDNNDGFSIQSNEMYQLTLKNKRLN